MKRKKTNVKKRKKVIKRWIRKEDTEKEKGIDQKGRKQKQTNNNME